MSSTEVFGALGSSSPQAQAVEFSCKDHGADATVELAPTMRAMGHSGSHANAGGQLAVCVTGDITHTLKAEGFDASEDGTGRGQPIVAAVALRGREGGATAELGDDLAGTLRASGGGGGDKAHALVNMAVRRLTPRECERLQGFPDDYTMIPGKRKNINPAKLDHDYIKYLMRGGVKTFEECMNVAADGPRYKALGNSWAIPNVRWIGARIDRQLKRLALKAA